MKISQELAKQIQQIVESTDCILYDITTPIENNQQILRVSIYHKNGITLDKCEEISTLLSPLLDVEDPFVQDYMLEVSSPGVERQLKNLKHYQYAVGERVRIRLNDKTECKGELINVTEEGIEVKNNKGIQKISFSEIYKTFTYFEW
ncbi:hypothetical protein CCZ01_04125 [Helicobacter monodelphidis]|uniref:ribosome maturation factor RimP n=1 Tax=Helicobacter sp. 15-1451 TaxID=2004995 RepID=UPI000DCDDEFE|nr:ribosome maturation factor RimP [Helicobacter sp. 15-1451]RAX58007.1 hypothetical protein CCZ01_04125 [Helicobacter sp. 15-1451]